MDGADQVAPSCPGAPACDDAALIAESLRTPERFGVLFDRHAPAIHRYAARRLGPDMADDIVADTFLAAFRRRHRYDPAQADACPWLFGIATRLIGRHRRDEVRFFRAIGRTGLDPATEPVADLATDRAAASAVRRQLADAIAGLSRAHRDVLLLTASGLRYDPPSCSYSPGSFASSSSSSSSASSSPVSGAAHAWTVHSEPVSV